MHKLQVLRRREFGDPLLRGRARRLTTKEIKSANLKRLIRNMYYTMRRVGGVGLAAPQIGYGIQLLTVHIPPSRDEAGALDHLTMINPKVISASRNKNTDWEGCLSLPSIRAKVPRATSIEVEWHNDQGELERARFSNFQARVIQHEIDHLHGVLFTDRVVDMKTLISVKEYEKLMDKTSG